MNDRKYRTLGSLLMLGILCLMLPACIDLAVNHGQNKHGVLSTQFVDGEVYTMRGGLGGIFSKGMNRLEDLLYNDYKIHSLSTVWFRANALSASIIKQYRSHVLREPIILVGHSLGGNDQIKVARDLYRAHIPVALLISIDPVSPLTVPPNVLHVVNIYKPSHLPLFSGLMVKAMDPEKTLVENINVYDIKGIDVNHFNITGNAEIQKIMLDKILQTFSSTRARRARDS